MLAFEYVPQQMLKEMKTGEWIWNIILILQANLNHYLQKTGYGRKENIYHD